MMIRPIVPYVFNMNQSSILPFIIGTVLTILMMTVIALLVARESHEKLGEDRNKLVLLFAGVGMLLSLLMLCFFGFAATAIRGILFSLVLAFSSYEDIKTRECSNYLHLMIVIAAFIGTELSALPGMIISAAFAGGVMLIACLFAKGKLGGADIKFAAASAFLLGIDRAIFGLLTGTLLSILVNIFKKNKKKGFPMIPYLAAGFMAAFFIQI